MPGLLMGCLIAPRMPELPLPKPVLLDVPAAKR